MKTNYVHHTVCITDDGLSVEFSGTREACQKMREELSAREHAQMMPTMARYEVYYGWGCPCGASTPQTGTTSALSVEQKGWW